MSTINQPITTENDAMGHALPSLRGVGSAYQEWMMVGSNDSQLDQSLVPGDFLYVDASGLTENLLKQSPELLLAVNLLVNQTVLTGGPTDEFEEIADQDVPVGVLFPQLHDILAGEFDTEHSLQTEEDIQEVDTHRVAPITSPPPPVRG